MKLIKKRKAIYIYTYIILRVYTTTKAVTTYTEKESLNSYAYTSCVRDSVISPSHVVLFTIVFGALGHWTGPGLQYLYDYNQ
jgi:hypothetical protein